VENHSLAETLETIRQKHDVAFHIKIVIIFESPHSEMVPRGLGVFVISIADFGFGQIVVKFRLFGQRRLFKSVQAVEISVRKVTFFKDQIAVAEIFYGLLELVSATFFRVVTRVSRVAPKKS